MPSLLDEHTQFTDAAGRPYVSGSIFIGTRNADPVANPITIFSDRALSVTLANPQTTDADGRSTNKIWVPGRYSIQVNDSDDVQVYQELDAGAEELIGNTALVNVQGTNTITAEGSPTAVTELVNLQAYIFQAANTVTGASTLQIDSTTAKSLRSQHDNEIAAGDIQADQIIQVIYNESDDWFEIQSNVISTIFTGTVQFAKGADIASAAALALGNDGNYFDITGTTTITSIGTINPGTWIKLHFDASLTLTHNATDLVLPGGLDIITQAGDEAEFVEFATGDWRLVNYFKPPLFTSATTVGTSSTIDITIPAGAKKVQITWDEVSTSVIGFMQLQIGDSGGIESSGYDYTTGTIVPGAADAQTLLNQNQMDATPQLATANESWGVVSLHLQDEPNNTWIIDAFGTKNETTSDATVHVLGRKSLSAELTTVRFVLTAGVFDDGFYAFRVEF